ADLTRAMVGREVEVRLENAVIRLFRRMPKITVAIALDTGNRVWGGLLLQLDLQGLSGLSPSVFRYFLIYMILVPIVLAGFGFVLMENVILKPVLELVEGTRSLSGGNLATRVRVPGRSEIGELAQAFNEMSERLQGMIHEREGNLQQLAEANEKLRNAQAEL